MSLKSPVSFLVLLASCVSTCKLCCHVANRCTSPMIECGLSQPDKVPVVLAKVPSSMSSTRQTLSSISHSAQTSARQSVLPRRSQQTHCHQCISELTLPLKLKAFYWLCPAGGGMDKSAPVSAMPDPSSREILPDFNLPVRLFHNC